MTSGLTRIYFANLTSRTPAPRQQIVHDPTDEDQQPEEFHADQDSGKAVALAHVHEVENYETGFAPGDRERVDAVQTSTSFSGPIRV